jgi:predicted AlkP superfamily phosphohydrolase/phosphomutase
VINPPETQTTGAAHLLIGLDGADLSLIRGFGARHLPHLHRALERGVSAALRCVSPPATLPNWTTLLTGHNPGKHGVFDFTLRRGYRVEFRAGSVRSTPSLVGRLDRLGQRCACLFFPGSFPPERLAHGIFASGWDAPVAFEADASFMWPPNLHAEIVQRFGPERFDEVDQFDTQAPDWHSRLPAALCHQIERRVALGRWLLGRQRFELFAIYFGQSDTAAHHLWSLHDPASPRRPPTVSPSAQAGLLRVYRALDAAVGELLAAAGGDAVELSVVSDHGSGGSSDKVLYLNRVLAEAGLLRFKPSAPSWLMRRAKDAALTSLPVRLRERLFRGFGAALPGLVESRARFGAIDMAHTRVFSDELNYFPALHFNLRGREPRGVLEPAELPALRREIEAVLYALRDPQSGQPVVTRVRGRDELFHGPQLGRAPDLLLELALDRGYSYNLMPSSSAPPGCGAFRRLDRSEYLGRKGRSLAGSHRERGVFIASGPRVRPLGLLDADIADVSATLLARMNVAVPVDLDGRVLHEALRACEPPQPSAAQLCTDAPSGLPQPSAAQPCTDAPSDPPQPSAAPTGPRLRAGEARVEARLRRLGYIE